MAAKPIPIQYKKMTDVNVLRLMDVAHDMWPIISELGDNFTCEHDGLIVKIAAAPEVDD